MTKRISRPMAIALDNIANGREPFCHIRGASQHGGAGGTQFALRRHGLVDKDFNLTEAGREALARFNVGRRA